MLDNRKKEVLKILLEKEGYCSVDELAWRMHVSEKTVRTDLKAIDSWLTGFPDVELVRKPKIGVYMQATPEAKKVLLQQLSTNQEGSSDQERRRLQIISLLLQKDQVLTMQQLANLFYVSKTTISHDLVEIDKWLTRWGLQLIRKTNVGLKIEGDERNWRAALSEVTEELARQKSSQELWYIDSAIQEQFLLGKYELANIERLIRNLEPSMNFRFTDEAVMNLTVHIAIAIKRIKQKKKIELPPDELEKLMQKKEFALATQLANALQSLFSVTLPESEIGYMTLHLLGAKVRQSDFHSKEPLQNLLEGIDPEALRITEQLIVTVDEIVDAALMRDRELRVGLAIHFHSVLNRLRHGLGLSNPLLQEIKQMYRYTFEVLSSVMPGLEKETGLHIPEAEIGYMVLHFQAALERSEKARTERKKALIVCSTGMGTAQLLATKLAKKYPMLDIIDSISSFEYKQAIAAHRPDLLISTIPLMDTGIPTVIVSPIFREVDQIQIERVLSDQSSPINKTFPTLQQFIIKECVNLEPQPLSRMEVIERMAKQLVDSGYVEEGFVESALSREWQSSTYIGGGIAIPHGNTRYIRKPGIAVSRFVPPIEWGDDSVTYVFMLAINLSVREKVEQLFAEISALMEDGQRLEQLKRQLTVEDFLNLF